METQLDKCLKTRRIEMKTDKRFNKFYTIIAGAASISILYQFLSSLWQLKLEISGLFLILFLCFFLSFLYSLGFMGGKKQHYGFTRNIDFMAIVTVLLALLIEIELWLYFAGFHALITILVYVQIALIVLIAIANSIRRIIIGKKEHRSSMH